MKAFGLDIVIESPKDSFRYGSGWTQLMANDYGYISNTMAVDGDEVDCFIGPNMASNKMFVITQINPYTGNFDEYKVMLGFNSQEEAYKAYMKNYQPGWYGFGAIREEFVCNFKCWYQRSLEQMHANA